MAVLYNVSIKGDSRMFPLCD